MRWEQLLARVAIVPGIIALVCTAITSAVFLWLFLRALSAS